MVVLLTVLALRATVCGAGDCLVRITDLLMVVDPKESGGRRCGDARLPARGERGLTKDGRKGVIPYGRILDLVMFTGSTRLSGERPLSGSVVGLVVGAR